MTAEISRLRRNNFNSTLLDNYYYYNKQKEKIMATEKIGDIEAEVKEMARINNKMKKIEEKGGCGSVRFLDRMANFLENSGNRSANWVRKITFKINAPCSLPFGSKKKK